MTPKHRSACRTGPDLQKSRLILWGYRSPCQFRIQGAQALPSAGRLRYNVRSSFTCLS